MIPGSTLRIPVSYDDEWLLVTLCATKSEALEEARGFEVGGMRPAFVLRLRSWEEVHDTLRVEGWDGRGLRCRPPSWEDLHSVFIALELLSEIFGLLSREIPGCHRGTLFLAFSDNYIFFISKFSDIWIIFGEIQKAKQNALLR